MQRKCVRIANRCFQARVSGQTLKLNVSISNPKLSLRSEISLKPIKLAASAKIAHFRGKTRRKDHQSGLFPSSIAVLRVGLQIDHQLDARTLPAMLSAANIMAATQTIDGPAGVSKI